MPRPTTFAVALACGAAGAYVDVSDYLEADDGFSYEYGRQSGFEDTPPSEFSFTLNNYDGRFTPENSASPLVIKVTEGMGVSWQFNTRLVSGTIQAIEPEFVDGVAAWARVRITADDMLGDLARTETSSLTDAMARGANPYLYYPLADAADASSVAEVSGKFALLLSDAPKATQLGVDPIAPVSREVELTSEVRDLTRTYVTGAIGTQTKASDPTVYPTFTYPTAQSFGWYGFWWTPLSENAMISLRINHYYNSGFGYDLRSVATITNTSAIINGDTSPAVDGPFLDLVNLTVGTPYYISLTADAATHTNVTRSLYINGTLVASSSATTGIPGAGPFSDDEKSPNAMTLLVPSSLTDPLSRSGQVSQLSHTPLMVHGEYALATTEANRFAAIAASSSLVTFDTLPAGLSTASVGTADLDSVSLLDALNDIIRTEQGYVYTATTGTLLAPVQKVKIRERDRPQTATATFAIDTDTLDSPGIRRDLTNLVSTVTVEGVGNVASTVSDPALLARARGATATEKTLFLAGADATAFGQDRLARGGTTQLQVYVFVLDGRGSSTDRYADILAMVPGNKYTLTGLPSAQLGFSSWSGWFLGRKETHSTVENTFELYFTSTLDLAPAIYDTDRYMADGALSLTSTINSAVTSMSVTSANVGQVLLSTTETPYVLQIDSEQVNVTAVTGATPQVVTMTRGFNGTTAAAHTAGALIDLATPTYYAF